MIKLIFRKSDRVHLYTVQDRAGSYDTEFAACLRNEGGAADDYIIADLDSGYIPQDMAAVLADDLRTITFKKTPERVASDKAVSLARKELIDMGISERSVKTILKIEA